MEGAVHERAAKEQVRQKEKVKIRAAQVAPLVKAPRPAQPVIKPERIIDITSLPLNEKVKRVVASYPLLSVFKIRRMLAHEKFGYTKVGRFKLYRILRSLNLDNKAKRYRFYRSV